MDDLHPEEFEPRPSLIVKLRVPAAFAQTPVETQLFPSQTEPTGYLQQHPSDSSVLKTSSVQPEHALADSPQSLLVSFPISNVRQEPIATSAYGDGGHMQDFHHDPSLQETSPPKVVAPLPIAPQDDLTTTAGAPFHDSASEKEQSINGDATSHQGSAQEPESECIRVTKPRPADEDESQAEPEPESQPSRPRASISISDLLRPASEEPVERHLPGQTTMADASGPPTPEAIYDTRAPQTSTAPDLEVGSNMPSVPVAGVMHSPSDVIMHDSMQEPDDDAKNVAAAATPVPQTPQTSNVVLKLSPESMAKFATFKNAKQPASYYGRERNPRRNATKAFGEVKTPEGVAPTANRRKEASQPEKEAVKSEKTPVGAKSKKRSAQGSDELAPTKRQKTDGAPLTRSSRGASEAPTSYPEFKAGPASELDSATGEPRPVRDVEGDRLYVQQMLQVLRAQSTAKTNDTAKEQALTMNALLERATYAGEDDALFLTASEATEQLAPGKFWNNVMITAEQQPLPLQTIEQFLREFYEEDVLVWIQDCSAKSGKDAPAIRQVTVKAVRQRFAADQPLHPKPWNLLELAAHYEDGLRPKFLNGEDCRLLTKLKIPTAADHSRRKTYPVGFKEVEKWALLAQAGALTLPHQDSHGYSTYITVNVGLVGFGWLSSPTPEKRKEWNKKTQKFIEGTWRYVILKPGQTVYFPAGTVHFVFRLPAAGNSLAFGGHVLRCSNIVHWVRCLLEEVQSASVTNEDLTDSATGYLERVEKFVLEARKNGNMELWGGAESVKEFLRLKAKFTALKKQSTK